MKPPSIWLFKKITEASPVPEPSCLVQLVLPLTIGSYSEVANADLYTMRVKFMLILQKTERSFFEIIF